MGGGGGGVWDEGEGGTSPFLLEVSVYTECSAFFCCNKCLVY